MNASACKRRETRALLATLILCDLDKDHSRGTRGELLDSSSLLSRRTTGNLDPPTAARKTPFSKLATNETKVIMTCRSNLILIGMK